MRIIFKLTTDDNTVSPVIYFTNHSLKPRWPAILNLEFSEYLCVRYETSVKAMFTRRKLRRGLRDVPVRRRRTPRTVWWRRATGGRGDRPSAACAAVDAPFPCRQTSQRGSTMPPTTTTNAPYNNDKHRHLNSSCTSRKETVTSFRPSSGRQLHRAVIWRLIFGKILAEI